jgi:hypothetical protein
MKTTHTGLLEELEPIEDDSEDGFYFEFID